MTKNLGRLACTAALVMASLGAQAQRPLAFTDIMKFREIKGTEISADGRWLAYSAIPDRGDATGTVQSTRDDQQFDIERGVNPVFDKSGQWAGFTVKQPLLTLEQADKKTKKTLKNGVVLVNLDSGKLLTFERVESYQLHDSGRWAALRFYPPAAEDKADKKNDKPGSDDGKDKSAKLYNKDSVDHQLVLVDLQSGSRQTVDNVAEFAFAGEQPWLSYAVSSKEGADNQLVALQLETGKSTVLAAGERASYSQLSWNERGDRLAFLLGDYQEKSLARSHELFQWRSGKSASLVELGQSGWMVPTANELRWSEDGQRLFFGLRPEPMSRDKVDTKITSEADLYNIDKLVAKKGLQIWHGQDPLIKPNEAVAFDDEQARYYQAVYDVKRDKVVRLADETVRDVEVTENSKALIATSDVPYLRERTWAGFFEDVYLVNLTNGKRSLVAERLDSSFAVEASPSGRYVAYYNDGHIWLFDSKKQRHQQLSDGLSVGFANEDHDYPKAAEGYGIAGWLDNDRGFLAYDKYDLWLFSTDGKPAKRLTDGRGDKRQLRIIKTDAEQQWFSPKETLLLKSYNDHSKIHGFYRLDLADGRVTSLVEGPKRYRFIAKAEDASTLVYSREDFNEFPDLWISESMPGKGRKVTDINPQIDEFLWGRAELVDWTSTDGEPHQGVLIKPANYREGERYPVLVYYYRLFSQRMYQFNQMKVNHRPNFPYYSSNGYAVFLPDVHFKVGTPGHATAKSIVPGVQKLVDMGIADPDAIGLHGHSWSGYQTAFTITETDIFKAAVAGAPVTNMTSAYSGIRLKSGLARQFQYETGQSRIGASLWQNRDLYVENSPVFYADRINTPLLMQFGDVDGAVPWEQGIEMYLAMRRLDKPVIFLQYEGEPHHLKKYPNKVDYSIKMKQFFDHHLKGKPAPAWMTEGVPYFKEDDEK